MTTIREGWNQQFGGGIIQFDTAYHNALAEGHTIAAAQAVGVNAVLDAFCDYLLNDLASRNNIASRTRVTRQAVNMWAKRHPDFPAPVHVFGGTPVYSWNAMVAWLHAHERGHLLKRED